MTLTAQEGYASLSQEELRAATYPGEHATRAVASTDPSNMPTFPRTVSPASPDRAPATFTAAQAAAADAIGRANDAALDARIKDEAAQAAAAAAAEAVAKAQACAPLSSTTHLPLPASGSAGGGIDAPWGLSGLVGGLPGLSTFVGVLGGNGDDVAEARRRQVVARVLRGRFNVHACARLLTNPPALARLCGCSQIARCSARHT